MANILGISCFYHDSAAALIINGDVVAAAQEERFTRIKHDAKFPTNAVKFVIQSAKLNMNNIDKIVFFEKPFLKFERLLETYTALAPKGFQSFKTALPIWIKDKLFQKKILINELEKIDDTCRNIKDKLFFSEHHLSHAASAFYPSPFENAIILTLDGVGEWATSTIAIGKKNKIEIVKEINFPHSLGLLYSAFTYYLGFKVNSGEYKVMGLAPYGTPIYKKKILDNLINVKEDGSFQLNLDFFGFATSLKMTNEKFHNLFGQEPRNASVTDLTQFHMDMASSIQAVIEDIILKICVYLKNEFKIPNLCMAGGVALNCVANGKIISEKIFSKIWIQPASGDAGTSLGAALLYWFEAMNNERSVVLGQDKMKGSYLGPKFSQKEIEKTLTENEAVYEILDEEKLIDKITNDLTQEKVLGWFHGKMEFGPRALGGRSILADPRSEKMQKNLNLKVKFRESFRPFAPSILLDDLSNWFDLNVESPYMLLVAEIIKEKKISMNENNKKLFGIEKLNLKRSNIPAVTHLDYTSRIQTVERNNNPRFYDLIRKFKEKTGCPVLVNTSFNVRGEPIVNTPLDAFKCFMGTDIDILVIENCYLKKVNQKKKLIKNYHDSFELD